MLSAISLPLRILGFADAIDLGGIALSKARLPSPLRESIQLNIKTEEKAAARVGGPVVPRFYNGQSETNQSFAPIPHAPSSTPCGDDKLEVKDNRRSTSISHGPDVGFACIFRCQLPQDGLSVPCSGPLYCRPVASQRYIGGSSPWRGCLRLSRSLECASILVGLYFLEEPRVNHEWFPPESRRRVPIPGPSWIIKTNNIVNPHDRGSGISLCWRPRTKPST